MQAQILKGKPIADEISNQINEKISNLSQLGVKVKISAIQVGDDPATEFYLNSQKKQAEKHGIEHELFHLQTSTTQDELIKLITDLNNDNETTGIILLTPLPSHIDTWVVQKAIDPAKDIEGIHPSNIGLLVYDKAKLIPCTALAAVKMLEATGIDLTGLEVVIIGRSAIVGKPLALLLLSKSRSATVTVCHTGTYKKGQLQNHISRADVVIAAMGSPHAIKGQWIKQDSIVIDVGVNDLNGKIVGDVEFEEASRRASVITPVPGGVGTVTTRILMLNAVISAEIQKMG